MNHSAETEIQQYALDKSSSSRGVVIHIESCDHCMARVRNYQLIFSEIRQAAQPAFDFDLAGLLIPQLPKNKPGHSPDRFIAGFLVVFICSCVGLPMILFGQYLLNMFSAIPPFFIYTTTCSAAVILIIRAFHMYRKYHRQMQLLNYH
jgi:hypothetical protein